MEFSYGHDAPRPAPGDGGAMRLLLAILWCWKPARDGWKWGRLEHGYQAGKFSVYLVWDDMEIEI